MKFNAILLYAIGAVLLLFGNRTLWNELQEERKQTKLQEKLVAQAEEATRKEFEVQKLVVDSSSGQLTNPHPYFQLINASYVSFKAIKRGKGTTVEFDEDEQASDSN